MTNLNANKALRISPRVYVTFLNYLYRNGAYTEVKGQRTQEILNFHGEVRNPIDRLITSNARKMNFPFGVLEWIGLITGEARTSVFTKYIKKFSEFSQDGVIIDGAYGSRLHGLGDQVEYVIRLLREDKQTRQAVISIYEGPTEMTGSSKLNIPCTLTLQFIYRPVVIGKPQLHCIVTMRSNDAIWGFTYDMFMFTMLHEYIAMRTGLPLGRYYHNAGSMHLYERDFDLVRAMKKEPRWTRIMPPMPVISRQQVQLLNVIYEYADNFDIELKPMIEKLDSTYLADFARAARLFFAIKEKDKSLIDFWIGQIEDYTIRRIMFPWLPKA